MPESTLIHNVTLACLSDDTGYDLVENGAVVTDKDNILWAGPRHSLPEGNHDLVLDGEQGLLTPGLVDCHTHLVYAGNRAAEFERRLQGVSYSEIARAGGGIMATVNATRNANEERLVDESAPRLRALMDEGVTTVEIKSGYGLDRDSEIRMLQAATRLGQQHGIRVMRTLLAAHALPPEFADRADDYIDLICDDVMPAAVEAGVVDAVDAFCENIGFSVAQVERVFQRARELDLNIKCHAEQLSDLGGTLLATRYEALSADHLEYLDPVDTASMAAAGTVAVLLPGAFYVLRETRLPPIQSLRDNRVPMALATDANPGSSPIFSPLLIMNMACTLFGLTPLEALAGFTINGARALGLQDEIGSIAVGKRADLALWRCAHPADLSYHIGLNPCVGSMRAGTWYPRTC